MSKMSYFWRSYRPMYKQKIAFIVFLGILAFSSCEKDDICVDGNTPLLVIRFYDNADTTLVKSVPNMVVRGIIEQDSLLPIIANVSGDSIAIPLRSDAGTTRFLILPKSDAVRYDPGQGRYRYLQLCDQIFVRFPCLRLHCQL